MKKTIRGIEYDTDTMEVVKQVNVGEYGDPAGYTEVLFVTADGKYALFCVGGETSPYPAEKLTSVSKAKAEAWVKDHE